MRSRSRTMKVIWLMPSMRPSAGMNSNCDVVLVWMNCLATACSFLARRGFASDRLCGSVPQAKDQPEYQKLYGVITAVNQPELERALCELIVDSEAGSYQSEAR